jgi:hypothetical protein
MRRISVSKPKRARTSTPPTSTTNNPLTHSTTPRTNVPRRSTHEPKKDPSTDYRIPLKTRSKKDAYPWLTWVHNQFAASVGTVDAMVLQKVLAAMHGYAQARTTRSAMHAQELLDCYIDEVVAQQSFSLAADNRNSTSPMSASLPSLNITVFNAALHAQALVGRIENAQHIFQQLQRLRGQRFPACSPTLSRTRHWPKRGSRVGDPRPQSKWAQF